MTDVQVIIEQHEDGFIAYPIGLKGVVVAQGDSYEGVKLEIISAIRFHIETFGPDVITDSDVKAAFVERLPLAG